ncbi:hypothetical protein D917_03073, partial [Trichinella nativa]
CIEADDRQLLRQQPSADKNKMTTQLSWRASACMLLDQCFGLHVRAELIAYKERSASRQICVALIAVLMVELECVLL